MELPVSDPANDVWSRHRRITILGVGQMGLVCAGVLASNPRVPEIVMWAHNADEAGDLTQTRKSPRLPGFILPDAARVTPDLEEALKGSSLVVSAIPVQYTRSVWERAGRFNL